MNENSLFALLDTLYAAVEAPQLWPAFLQATATAMNGQSGWLSRIDLSDRTGTGLVVGIDPAMQREYFDHHYRHDPFTFHAMAPGPLDAPYTGIMTDRDCISRDELERSPFHNDFLSRIDVNSIAMVRLGRRGSHVHTLNINRSRRREPFGPADLAGLGLLQAHVSRAVALSQRLAEIRLGEAAGAGGGPVLFLVDRTMRVEDQSEAADAWCGSRATPFKVQGRLRLADPGDQGRLARLVASASARQTADLRGGSLAIRDGGGASLAVTVLPVGGAALGPFRSGATALVAVEPARRAADATDSLSRFGLTRSERGVAQGLLDGLTPREIARERGVSRTTVRNQIGSIMAKTGTHRQAELVRTLLLAQA